jgi:hypothetical protein
MIIMQEARKLVLLKGYYYLGMDVYVFSCEGRKITLQYITDEQIAKLFRIGHVKDTESEPKSTREKTYMEMVWAMKSGEDNECWIWSNMIEVFFSAADDLRRNRIGRVASAVAGSLGA